MERTPEPLELMLDTEQVRAYGTTDLSRLNSTLIVEFQDHFGGFQGKRALDLGSGTADIAMRFAELYPEATVVGIDGSPAMLDLGREFVSARGLQSRIELRLARLPLIGSDAEEFDAVVANSLLHHLSDPFDLWNTIHACARPGASVMVVDLIRPVDPEDARALVEKHASRGHPLVKQDFFNSLCAAYTIEDVRGQLQDAGLTAMQVQAVSELQFVAWGTAQ